MKKFTFTILMIFLSRLYAQTICEGQQDVPIETFNQCNSNPLVLVFEDNFDGNSLDFSKWQIQPLLSDLELVLNWVLHLVQGLNQRYVDQHYKMPIAIINKIQMYPSKILKQK